MEDKVILEKLKRGEVSPQDAVAQVEMGDTKWVSEIPLDSIYAEVLDCGFESLNQRMVFKKNRGDLIVLGAYSGHGKSAMMLQIAQYVAGTAGPVLVFSTEMGREDLLVRILAERTKENCYALSSRQKQPDRVKQTHANLAKLPLAINVRDSGDISSILRATHAMHRRTPLSLIAVDHIHNVVGTERGNKAVEVGGVSRELKQLALRLRVPVLALAQLNRGAIQRGEASMKYGKAPDFLPTLYDLKDSGGIGQDADAVVFVSRYEEHIRGKRVGEADIVLEKCRNGRTGKFVWKWDGESTRFTDPANALVEGI